MSRNHQRSSLLSVALAALIAAPCMFYGTSSAQADVRIRVRGKVKVRAAAPKVRVRRVRARHRPYRTQRPRVRLRVGAGVYWSGGVYIGRYATPPPPPPVYDCNRPVPAYYTRPAPRPMVRPPVAVVSAPRVAPLPRLGVGLFAGATSVNDSTQGQDVGLLGRLRLTDSFLVEAEIAKSEMDEARIDRRLGGALLYDVSPRSRWSVQLLAGAGVTQTDMGGGAWVSDQEYGELGAGLTYKLTPRLHLSGDLRAGVRTPVDGAPTDDGLKQLAPSSVDEEEYTRGRLSAVLYF